MTENNDPRYPTPEAGIERLNNYKDDWCGNLGSRAVYASYAIIAGVWAVFGNQNNNIDNVLALIAITLAIMHIGLCLVIIFLNIYLMANRSKYAQKHPEKWKREWQNSKPAESHWPFTAEIHKVGFVLHWTNLILPVASAIFLILAFWL